MAESPDTQSGDVLEGHLCPICIIDLKTISQLQEHFEIVHGSEPDVLKALKGFFGKAKRKILKQDNEIEEGPKSLDECNFNTFESSYHDFEYDLSNQDVDLGCTTSHTKAFMKYRETKIDGYVMETNKLLIRLDKLISEAPDDPEKRKAHEKNVVPWIPDADVKLCPGCAKSFGLSRRRHHCRLCGGVMCQTCSHFIDFVFARKLTQPIAHDEDQQLALPVFSPLQRRGSNTSLLSVVNFSGESHIRTCKDCKVLLDRRKQQMDNRGHKPIIIHKYEKMREYMAEIEKLEPLYCKMVDSLCIGEIIYHLRDVQELKVKISRMAEAVDVLSKVIAKLENTDEDENSKALQLQSSIRVAAAQFLRSTVLGLPPIPTEKEIARFKRKRELEIQRKIQLEKEMELHVEEPRNVVAPKSLNVNAKPHNSESRRESRAEISPECGWSASPGNLVEEGNPMLQQINIIRKYIKQARQDHKFDEVHMLEANLKDLQEAYLKQQNASPS